MGAASSLASHFSFPRLDGLRSAPVGHRNEYSIEYYYRSGKAKAGHHLGKKNCWQLYRLGAGKLLTESAPSEKDLEILVDT